MRCLWRPWLQRSDDITSFRSLRFFDSGTEAAFAQDQTETLMTNFFMCSLSVFMMSCLSMGFRVSAGDKLDYTCSTPRRHIFFVTSCCVLAIGIISIIGMLSSLCWKYVVQFSQFKCEVFTISLCLGGMFFAAASESHYAARLIAAPEAAIEDLSPSDAWMLLMIDFLITLTHLSLPVRWCMLLPLQVCGPLLYALFAFGLGSPQAAQVPLNFALLVSLSYIASLGKRALERHQRLAFWKLLAEKSARCESDFKLAQIEDDNRIHTSDITSHHSLPTTTASGHLFQGSGPGIDDSKLLEISKVGQAEHWLVDTEAMELFPDCILGSGGYGVVFEAALLGTPVACKISRRRDLMSTHRMPYLVNELRILRHLRHPNLVGLFGACIDLEQKELALVFELLQGVTLNRFIASGKHDPLLKSNLSSGSTSGQILLHICQALRCLHGHHPVIIHSDLKPANIMIDSVNGTVHAKLLDFGLASLSTRHAKRKGGTPKWTAPEVTSGCQQLLHTASDIYSLGLVTHYVLTGKVHKVNTSELVCVQESDSAWSTGLGFLLKGTCEKCLRMDASSRPCIQEVHKQVAISIESMPEPDASCYEHGAVQRSVTTTMSRSKVFHGMSWREGIKGLREVTARMDEIVHKPSPPKGGQLLAIEEGHSSSDPPGSGQDLRFPRLRRTPRSVQQAMLFETASLWNSKMVLPHACCEYHAIIQSAERTCQELTVQACRSMPQDALEQCNRCGVLAMAGIEDVQKCDVCENFHRKKVLISASAPSSQSGLRPVQEDECIGLRSEEKALRIPKFKMTPSCVQQVMLFDTAYRWNCVTERHACCEFHTLANAVENACKAMRSRACCHVSIDCYKQCAHCGVLELPAESGDLHMCSVCGFEQWFSLSL